MSTVRGPGGSPSSNLVHEKYPRESWGSQVPGTAQIWTWKCYETIGPLEFYFRTCTHSWYNIIFCTTFCVLMELAAIPLDLQESKHWKTRRKKPVFCLHLNRYMIVLSEDHGTCIRWLPRTCCAREKDNLSFRRR